MLKRNSQNKSGFVQMVDIESLVPSNHLVRKVLNVISFDFIYDLVETLYSEDIGRPSIDPVILFKIVFIQYLFNIRSMRETIEQINMNIAYRYFLGFDFTEPIPHFSTFSQNYIRRYKDTTIFEEIFNTILYQVISHGLVKTDNIFVDSTHVKAYANKRKITNEVLNATTTIYMDKLETEINEERKKENKKEIELYPEKKEIISLTDPECGMFHKGEKERQLAYSNQVISDENGWVLASSIVSGNTNDGKGGQEIIIEYVEKHSDELIGVVMDSGYDVPIILEELLNRGVLPVVPYHKPKGIKLRDGDGNVVIRISKDSYEYDGAKNIYVCPQGKKLGYSGTNTLGYKEYKSKKKDCLNCPLKHKCTGTNTKTITRHFYEKSKKYAQEIRNSEYGREIYKKRKTSIERVFANSKMNHCLGFTFLRGLRKNENRSFVIFAMQNLKKLATIAG